jgi:hypothetical protein
MILPPGETDQHMFDEDEDEAYLKNWRYWRWSLFLMMTHNFFLNNIKSSNPIHYLVGKTKDRTDETCISRGILYFNLSHDSSKQLTE